MAQPLLDFLTGRARAALPYLEALAARNVRTADVFAILQGFDLSFQRQRVLDVYASLQGRIDPERTARLVGQGNVIPDEFTNVAPVKIKNQYSYLVSTPNIHTGEKEYGTVGSDVPLSANTIRVLAVELFTINEHSRLEDQTVGTDQITIERAQRSGLSGTP